MSDFIILGRLTDEVTNAAIAIDWPHYMVHEGLFFRSGMNYSLANGNVAAFGLTTPSDGKLMHLEWDLSASADGTFTVVEDVTSFSGGAGVTPLNHNRGSLNVSKATCIRGMTGVDLVEAAGGTTILSATLSTGKGSTIDRSLEQEFILKQNCKYLFQYTNGTSANVIRLVFEWYEHITRKSFGA